MVECSPSIKRAKPTPAGDLFVCPWTTVVDSREQAPWTFQNIIIEKRLWVIRREVKTMTTGDYSINGFENLLAIERKSACDLVSSISYGNTRFRREHERMKTIVESGGFACVMVEGSLSAICEDLNGDDGRRVTSDMIIGATASWPQKYGAPWLFAGDRRHAELLAFRIMLKWWKQAHGAKPGEGDQ